MREAGVARRRCALKVSQENCRPAEAAGAFCGINLVAITLRRRLAAASVLRLDRGGWTQACEKVAQSHRPPRWQPRPNAAGHARHEPRKTWRRLGSYFSASPEI